ARLWCRGAGRLPGRAVRRARCPIGAASRRRAAPAGSRAAIGGGACAASSGLPAPTVAGIGVVLGPVAARSAVPVRWAFLGAAIAVIVVIGRDTFGASFDPRVSPPPPLRVELELRA